MLTADGRFEHYGLIDAVAAHWHHSWLVSDIEAYDRDDTLRYRVVRSPRPPHGQILQLAGDAALDPYDTGTKQIETLAAELFRRGMPDHIRVDRAEMGFKTLHDGPRLGVLADWL